MRDTLTTRNARDFSARYVNSYGYYIDDTRNIRLPVFLRHLDGDSTLIFEDLNGVELTAYANKGVEFEFMQMSRKIYAGVNGVLYYIERKPARQWSRGVCSANTSCWQLTPYGAEVRTINHTLMKAVMFDGATKFDSGTIKLSNEFAIVESVVYLYNFVIGSYNRESKRISLASGFKMFQVELQDCCKQHNIEVK